VGTGDVSERNASRNDSLSRVGIVAALQAEARALCPTIEPRGQPTILKDGTLLAVSGIGPAAAIRATLALIDAGADALVSFGLAGGLDPALSAGAIVLPSEVICVPDGALSAARDWRERVGRALASSQPVVGGKLLTSPKAITGVLEKADVFRATGAVAVDMESFAVAQTAAVRGMPFLAVRVIVDTARDALPRAVMVANESGQVRLWRLIGALLATPADIVGVIRLGGRYRVASRSLRTAAVVLALREAGAR
jgi:adenosylhomocysteine nucleosidase